MLKSANLIRLMRDPACIAAGSGEREGSIGRERDP